MGQVPEKLARGKIATIALVIDVEPMHQVLEASRERTLIRSKLFKPFKPFAKNCRNREILSTA